MSNEIFKRMKTKKIILCDKYHLAPDQFKGLVLVLEEPRVRVKKDTEIEETYTFVDKWYHLTLSQTLENYLKQTTLKATSIEELKEIVLRVENVIETIK